VSPAANPLGNAGRKAAAESFVSVATTLIHKGETILYIVFGVLNSCDACRIAGAATPKQKWLQVGTHIRKKSNSQISGSGSMPQPWQASR
jgi:hypothetical protein